MARNKWYNAGLKFECSQCGNCCSGAPGYVWATKEEIRLISKFLSLSDEAIRAKHVRRVGFRYSLTEKGNGDCTFLKREGGRTMCGVYHVRPLQCRTWPFWSSNLRSSNTWNEAHKICPGINSGQHHDFIAIEKRRTQKSW